MKKLFGLIYFCLNLSFCFANFIDGKFSRFVECNVSSTTTRGIERYNAPLSVQGGVESRWAEGVAGFQAYEKCFDFTAATKVWLPVTDWSFESSRIALGLGGVYHFQRYKGLSWEHDYILNSLFRYQNLYGTTITFYGGYAGKATKLDAISGLGSRIYDDYPEAGILIDKVFQNGFEIYCEHALNDFYRYPLFCMPHYLLGGAVNLDSGLRFSGDVSMRISDGYAASPYVNSLILKFGMRYTF